MKKRLSVIAIGIAAVAGTGLVSATPAAASEEFCFVVLVVDTPPGVILESGKVGVETGEYHYETNCIEV